MGQENAASFIFYLLLDENLPKAYYSFDRKFRDSGHFLVPVTIDQLQTLASLTSQNHIIVLSSVSDVKEYRLFNEKVRGLLKFILKSKKLTFMQLSSFSRLNDAKKYTMTKNYFFLKYPVDSRELVARIVRYYDLKGQEQSRWPGGKRAGIGAMAS